MVRIIYSCIRYEKFQCLTLVWTFHKFDLYAATKKKKKKKKKTFYGIGTQYF